QPLTRPRLIPSARTPGRGTPMAKTVLVVEDNGYSRKGLAAILRRHGYDVAAVGDGLQALDRLDVGPPVDVILLDMLLPVLDGWHFLQRLRTAPGGAPPIIVTSGAAVTPGWAAAHGCAGLLQKPGEEAELLGELGGVLGDR